MVINHLEKLFVTNDAATILRELEVGFLASEDVSCELAYLWAAVMIYVCHFVSH